MSTCIPLPDSSPWTEDTGWAPASTFLILHCGHKTHWISISILLLDSSLQTQDTEWAPASSFLIHHWKHKTLDEHQHPPAWYFTADTRHWMSTSILLPDSSLQTQDTGWAPASSLLFPHCGHSHQTLCLLQQLSHQESYSLKSWTQISLSLRCFCHLDNHLRQGMMFRAEYSSKVSKALHLNPSSMQTNKNKLNKHVIPIVGDKV